MFRRDDESPLSEKEDNRIQGETKLGNYIPRQNYASVRFGSMGSR